MGSGDRRLVVLLAAACAALALGGGARGGTLPTSFQETTVFSGLVSPSAVRFAADGRVFVAEKSGLVKVFASLATPTPTVFADLRGEVDDFWDRGLLGLALDPSFPTKPYVYVLYTYDAAIGGTAPLWGDACPTPPGPNADGCVVSARLARLTASGNTATAKQVLIEDWCQQYPSHSIGDLHFGPDGALYASGGDGASFTFTDYGQKGSPLNPCGDPPVPVGGTQTPPGAEGGALRSQGVRRAAGEPVGLDGSIIRVDPATGAALPDNPLEGNPDPNAKRVVAYGLRNPFRFTFRPGTSEIWVGDVGYNTWEEINRIPSASDAVVENLGWPCYEGVGAQPAYQSANLSLCQRLYNGTDPPVTAPYLTYNHGAKVVAGETCPTGSSSVTGTAFYTGGNYPASYNGALFFADHSRNCIWAMLPGGNGLPSTSQIVTFDAGASNPVDVEVGPGGDIFYVDHEGGTIRRISYLGANRAPSAVATGTPTSGPAPLTVSFDGSGSSDPDAGDTITYAWDLNGDGLYDDSTAVRPTFTYTRPGTYPAGLKVTDSHGASSVAPVTVTASNTPPTPSIAAPAATLTWKVGDTISFSGSATDAQDGTLPASALLWTLVIQHCPSNCHTHVVQTFAGVAAGSFVAPDHDYPSYLELRLTATDSGGLSTTTSVSVQPQTATLSFASSPSGLQLVVGPSASTTPFTRTVIVGSTNTISATTPQTLGGTSYDFASWSDGGAQTHDVVAPAGGASYTASYTAGSSGPPPGLVAAYGFNEGSGPSVADASGNGNGGTTTSTTWLTAGKYGSALSFNGSSSWVTVADSASLDLTTGMTLEAWVNPSALGSTWRTVVFKEQPGEEVYTLYANDGAGHPIGQIYNAGAERDVRGPSAPPLNAWTHLAATYDGAALRLYVNGALAATFAVSAPIDTSSGALRIGGNSIWGERFSGGIDEVRVYNRPLSQAEIQGDMATPIAPAPPDTVAPTVSITAPGAGATVSGTTTVTASAADNVGVAGVQFRLDGASLGAEDTSSPYSVSWDTTTAANGSHTLTAVARDAAGNPASSAPVAVTVSNTAPPPPPSGLVAAYGFNEGMGTAVADSSGRGNNGTTTGTTWLPAGKFGAALSFNGTSSWVTVPGTASLDLTTGMTLEAWVDPSALSGSWRTVLFKERPGGISYSLYAAEGASHPIGQVYVGGEQNAVGTTALPLNAWSHLAVTYDGAALKLYVNGALAASKAQTGAAAVSTGVLRIGGNAVWSEFFQGGIDEVRVYNRALSQAEIQSDMAAPVR